MRLWGIYAFHLVKFIVHCIPLITLLKPVGCVEMSSVSLLIIYVFFPLISLPRVPPPHFIDHFKESAFGLISGITDFIMFLFSA